LLKIGNKRIIEIVVEKLKEVFSDIIIVTNSPPDYQFLDVKLIKDLIPGKGPLGGIYTGLLLSDSEYNFVCACDMPFLSIDLLKVMISEMDGSDLIVPVVRGFVEPLHSIYSKRCLAAIKFHLEVNDLKVKSFFPEVKCKYFP
jgi:molybdopterin-guanine dinucleotide biosynthesis protein A